MVRVEVSTNKRVSAVTSDAALEVVEKRRVLGEVGVRPGRPVTRINAEGTSLDPRESWFSRADYVHWETTKACYSRFAVGVVVP